MRRRGSSCCGACLAFIFLLDCRVCACTGLYPCVLESDREGRLSWLSLFIGSAAGGKTDDERTRMQAGAKQIKFYNVVSHNHESWEINPRTTRSANACGPAEGSRFPCTSIACGDTTCHSDR